MVNSKSSSRETSRKSQEKYPTNKVLVLDIDSTIIDTFHAEPFIHELEYYSNDDEVIKEKEALRMWNTLPEDQRYYFELEGNPYIGVKRPYVAEFLSFARRYFRYIIVWTAGSMPYANSILKVLNFHPDKVLARENTVYKYNRVKKPLNRIFNDPDYSSIANPSNTLMVDDNWTFEETPENGILIPPYKRRNKSINWYFPGTVEHTIRTMEERRNRVDESASLKEETVGPRMLRVLEEWFELPQVRNSTDVRLLDKRDIFVHSEGYWKEYGRNSS